MPHAISWDQAWGADRVKQPFTRDHQPMPPSPCDLYECRNKMRCIDNDLMCLSYKTFSLYEQGGSAENKARKRQTIADPAARENPTHEIWVYVMEG